MGRCGQTLLGNSAGDICGCIDHRFDADRWVSIAVLTCSNLQRRTEKFHVIVQNEANSN